MPLHREEGCDLPTDQRHPASDQSTLERGSLGRRTPAGGCLSGQGPCVHELHEYSVLHSLQHRCANRSKTNKMPRHKPLQCTLDFKPTPKYIRRVVSQPVRHPLRCLGSSAAGAMSLNVTAPGPPQSTPNVCPPRCELAGKSGDEAGSHHRCQSDGLTGNTAERVCTATGCSCKSHGSVSGPSRANGQARVRLGFLGLALGLLIFISGKTRGHEDRAYSFTTSLSPAVASSSHAMPAPGTPLGGEGQTPSIGHGTAGAGGHLKQDSLEDLLEVRSWAEAPRTWRNEDAASALYYPPGHNTAGPRPSKSARILELEQAERRPTFKWQNVGVYAKQAWRHCDRLPGANTPA